MDPLSMLAEKQFVGTPRQIGAEPIDCWTCFGYWLAETRIRERMRETGVGERVIETCVGERMIETRGVV